jgi:hypothetical protein
MQYPTFYRQDIERTGNIQHFTSKIPPVSNIPVSSMYFFKN